MPRNMPSLPVILLLEHVDRQNLIVCSSVLVHRSLLEAEAAHSLQSFGFGDMQYGQDYDLWRRCLALSSRDVDGFRVGASIVKEALVVYDTKGSDRSSVRKEVGALSLPVWPSHLQPPALTTPASSTPSTRRGFSDLRNTFRRL
uniref:Uncharacterized protein n=1 Tax=Rhizochromulina marina TaxID=1034831 RepID=A0A6U0YLK0_9STRA|mmetsp:Transcript_18588/g.54168  ORF Transcript_18588/g.54168 Transcript_18588/m.54168 type:complete len:144 (+) Transcript_18588:604-1035(+)